MKVSVWDTYVTRKDGKVMHFDILVPEEMKDAEKVYDYGKQYLSGKPVLSESLSAKECTFCHVEEATEEMKASIHKTGYHIIEMEHCE